MEESRRLVQFGGGNIGRSFVGQIFGRNGWEVVFVDVDRPLIERLNADNSYQVVVKHPDGLEERLTVPGVRAVDASEPEAVARELEQTQYVATSVGAGAIRHIVSHLAREVERRASREPGRRPFDLILAENIHDGAALLRRMLTDALPEGFDEARLPGIIECSVGKMVPLIPQAVLEREPTTVYAEPYNTLILASAGWHNGVPKLPELAAVDTIAAYVDRKLFIHNMGHAAVAYLGYRSHPGATYLWELLEDRAIRDRARSAMTASAQALAAAYPQALSGEELAAHIDDLLYRFANRALGDTVYRVGRDLRRKLAPTDRVVGALRLAERYGVPVAPILEVYAAAVGFRAPDENGALYESDQEFHRRLEIEGLDYALTEVSGLSREEPLYEKLRRLL